MSEKRDRDRMSVGQAMELAAMFLRQIPENMSSRGAQWVIDNPEGFIRYCTDFLLSWIGCGMKNVFRVTVPATPFLPNGYTFSDGLKLHDLNTSPSSWNPLGKEEGEPCFGQSYDAELALLDACGPLALGQHSIDTVVHVHQHMAALGAVPTAATDVELLAFANHLDNHLIVRGIRKSFEVLALRDFETEGLLSLQMPERKFCKVSKGWISCSADAPSGMAHSYVLVALQRQGRR